MQDDRTRDGDLNMWVEEADTPEEELFKVLPFLQKMINKSKNPVIAIQPLAKGPQ